jgi:hypothetical protein
VIDCSGTSLCGDFENLDEQATDQVTGADDGSGQCTWGTDATYMTVANIVFLACGILLCWYVVTNIHAFVVVVVVVVIIDPYLFDVQCPSTGAHLQAIEASESNYR